MLWPLIYVPLWEINCKYIFQSRLWSRKKTQNSEKDTLFQTKIPSNLKVLTFCFHLFLNWPMRCKSHSKLKNWNVRWNAEWISKWIPYSCSEWRAEWNKVYGVFGDFYLKQTSILWIVDSSYRSIFLVKFMRRNKAHCPHIVLKSAWKVSAWGQLE